MPINDLQRFDGATPHFLVAAAVLVAFALLGVVTAFIPKSFSDGQSSAVFLGALVAIGVATGLVGSHFIYGQASDASAQVSTYLDDTYGISVENDVAADISAAVSSREDPRSFDAEGQLDGQDFEFIVDQKSGRLYAFDADTSRELVHTGDDQK
jgi:hypothetical protein